MVSCKGRRLLPFSQGSFWNRVQALWPRLLCEVLWAARHWGGWGAGFGLWTTGRNSPHHLFFLVGRKGKGVGRGRSTQLFTCSALLSPTAVCRRIQFHLPLCLDSVALSQIARTYKFSLRSGEKPPETMFDESICTKQVTFWDGILCFWPQSSEKNLAFWIAFK